MKVAVVSDTHGCLSMLDRCIKLAGQVDVWCHLGDLTSDAEALMSRTNAKGLCGARELRLFRRLGAKIRERSRC